MKSFFFVGLLIAIVITYLVGITGGLAFALGWSFRYLWDRR
jgi:hypothetical protein